MYITHPYSVRGSFRLKVEHALPPAAEVNTGRVEVEPRATVREARSILQSIDTSGSQESQLLAQMLTASIGKGQVKTSPVADGAFGPKDQQARSFDKAFEVCGRFDVEHPRLDLLARRYGSHSCRLTFDMRGMARLAGASPLDGGIRPHARPATGQPQ